MSAKQAARAGAQTLHEWEAFLALSQIMDFSTLDANVYSRLEKACGRLAERMLVTRDELILESGLSFFDECAEPDLALMALVRKGVLQPIAAQPFCFQIHDSSDAGTELEKRAPDGHSGEECSMQQANFTADSPSASPVLLPDGHAGNSQDAAVAELPPEIAGQLKRPLSPEAISAQSHKTGLFSVKVIYIIERLNEVFGLNGWEDNYEVVENGPMVVVRGCLRVPRYGIVRQQYGGNDNPDRGDAYKGACTDALSKCASQLGIAIDVYKGRGAGSLPLQSLVPESSGTQNPDRIDFRPDSADDRARRFREMERVLGKSAYVSVFLQHGYPEEPGTLDIENARSIYVDLLRILRRRLEILRHLVDHSSYRRVLSSLRLSTNAKLNAEQLSRVFEALWEVIDAQP